LKVYNIDDELVSPVEVMVVTDIEAPMPLTDVDELASSVMGDTEPDTSDNEDQAQAKLVEMHRMSAKDRVSLCYAKSIVFANF
jgi:hypothetical protein